MPRTGVRSVLELSGVSKRYGRKGAYPDALSGVSLRVPERSVSAVVGPNGAGKSTLLSLALGFIRPSAGTVTLAGEPPREFVREHGAGYLPERFGLPREWRVRDALRMLAQLDRQPSAVQRTIDELGLAPFLEKRIGELSRGMLQRVGIAQALLARRRLIVLDEPTEGLDPVWRIRLRDLLGALRDDGATILLASHDLAEVERVADRAIVLDAGTVRDVIDTRAARDDVAAYRIRLREPLAEFETAFPSFSEEESGVYTVSVETAVELTERLGALIELGAVIVAVEPVHRPLEQRVRDTLEQT